LPIFGEKIGVFLKTNVIITIFAKSNSLSKKRKNFRLIFRRKYFKNHNIGQSGHPEWLTSLPPAVRPVDDEVVVEERQDDDADVRKRCRNWKASTMRQF
jgi:hypothetical protein